MNYHIYIGAGITVIFNLIIAAKYYGRYTQKVDDHDKKIAEHGARIEEHHSEIGVVYGHLGLRR